MLRFLLLTLTLCLGCALIISAAVAVGRTQPPSEAVRWLRINECETPCVMGLKLGKTSYAEAKQTWLQFAIPSDHHFQILELDAESVEATKDLQWDIYSINGSNRLRFYATFKKNVLTGVTVYFNTFYSAPTLGDLLNLYGVPICTYTNRDHGGLEMDIPGNSSLGSIGVKVVKEPVQLTSPVSELFVGEYYPERECPCLHMEWQGLTAEYPAIDAIGCHYPK